MSFQPADYRNKGTRHAIITGIDKDISNATIRGQFILRVDITQWPEYVRTEIITELNTNKYHTEIISESRGTPPKDVNILVISWK